MQVKVFTIPIFDGECRNEEMNAFLRGHRVLTVDKQFCLLGNSAVWSFCVTYLDGVSATTTSESGTKKVDYRNELDPATFAIFARLRTVRKQIADADAVPAYAVFTDAELARIAELHTLEPRLLRSIDGIGIKRVEKYGEKLCRQYAELMMSEGTEQQ